MVWKNENFGPKLKKLEFLLKEYISVQARILAQNWKNRFSTGKSYFGSRIKFSAHQNMVENWKKLTLLLKNSVLSSCKGDSFLLSLHFFNLFFTIFFFFNCFCFLNKFIVIFLKNAVRYLSTIYRVQNGAKKQIQNSPWNVFFGGDKIHFRTYYMRLGRGTSMNLYQVSEITVRFLKFFWKIFLNFFWKWLFWILPFHLVESW